MKKNLLLLILLLSSQLFAKVTIYEKQDNKPADIKLIKGSSTNDDTRPRTLIPIICIYADGTVQLTFLGDFGEYTLTVTNQSTGEQWTTLNTPMLPVSTNEGSYCVEIELENGDSYYGEYIL